MARDDRALVASVVEVEHAEVPVHELGHAPVKHLHVYLDE